MRIVPHVEFSPERSRMSTKLSPSDMGQALSGLFAALQIIRKREPRITVAEIQAAVQVALQTMDLESTNLPAVSDVARALDMSTSGASRVLSGLAQEEGPALVTSNRGRHGTRSEAFVMTDKGREVITSMLTALTRQSAEDFQAHTFKTYAQARYIDETETTKLRAVRWDESTLTLVAAPAEEAQSEEIEQWYGLHLSAPPKLTPVEDGAALQFAKVADAVYFRMRWC